MTLEGGDVYQSVSGIGFSAAQAGVRDIANIAKLATKKRRTSLI
jgi:hypothetical protein